MSRRTFAIVAIAAVFSPCGAYAQDAVAPVRTLAASGFSIGTEPTKGAYFYKVTTGERTDAKAIEGRGVLPRVTFDPARQHAPTASEPEYLRGPLDVPSVYMGGHAGTKPGGTELDAGLAWSRVLDSAKRPLWTDDPSGSDMGRSAHRFRLDTAAGQTTATDADGRVFAVTRTASGAMVLQGSGATLLPDYGFRPYWRTMTRRTDGKKGFLNEWHNPQPGEKGYFWLYPGDRFRMRIEATGPERVRFEVGLADDPSKQLDVTFAQALMGTGAPLEFKRVNSIDQFRELPDGTRKGNEGRNVIPTRARVEGGRWDRCSLVLSNGGERVPVIGADFFELRGAELASRFGSVFKRSGFTSAGGESIEIVPISTGFTGRLP